MAGLEYLDWIVIALYFVVLVGIVWWSARRQKSTEDYFLAGRNVGWFVIGASLFASNIGSEHLVGLAGSGAKDGMAMAHYELHAWCLLVLGWVLVPFYSRAAVFTMPEFLERRYNSTSRWILSIVSLVAYVLTKVSVSLYAGGIVFSVLLPKDIFGGLDTFWVGAITVMVLTGIYTMLGGLRAVLFTDAMQAVVLIVGSVCITAYGLAELGGWGQLRELVGSKHFNMWRPANDPDFPWAGILFGAPIVGLWYWCTDQYIVQRTLAAKNIKVARRSTIFGAYLKLTPVFLFIIPGMIAAALVASGKLELAKNDHAFPLLAKTLLPIGLRGLVVGGLLAALMSSLSSLFNSCSTLFTVDIYEKLYPGKSEEHLVRVGRIATGAVVVLGMLWIPMMKYVSGALYTYLQAVQAYLAPPITAVFFLGIFSTRINGKGAVSGLITGFVLGMSKLVTQVLATMETARIKAAEALNADIAAGKVVGVEPASTDVTLPQWVMSLGQFNWLYFCLVLFAVSVTVVVVVSLLSKRPAMERLAGLTFATTPKGEGRTWTKWDVINTVIILSIIASVYVYFTG